MNKMILLRDKKYLRALKMLFLTLACGSSMLAHSQNNAGLKPNDFAFGMQILPNGSAGLQVFELPQAFYAGVARNDMGDMRIFNEEVQSLPFKIRHNTSADDKSEIKILPIFPIYISQGSNLDELSFQLNKTDTGTVIDVKEHAVIDKKSKKLIAYIVDNSRLPKDKRLPIENIDFDWEVSEQTFIKDIKIEQSDDLSRWKILVENGILSRLNFAGEQLEQNIIKLPHTKANYLRITWPGLKQPLTIKKIKAEFKWLEQNSNKRSYMLGHVMQSFEGKVSKLEQGAYHFNMGGHYPMDQLEFISADKNAFYKGSLYSRASTEMDWNYRGHFTQYDLDMSVGKLQSQPIPIGNVRDLEWLVKFDYPAAVSNQQLPAIRIAWTQEQVIFLAQGKQPYVLAHGNPNIKSISRQNAVAINGLAKDMQPELAKLTPVYPLGGNSKLELAEKPFDWRVLLLWAALIAGVALMIWMAIGLYKQMNQAD